MERNARRASKSTQKCQNPAKIWRLRNFSNYGISTEWHLKLRKFFRFSVVFTPLIDDKNPHFLETSAACGTTIKVSKPKAGPLSFTLANSVLEYPGHPNFDWWVRMTHCDLYLKRFFVKIILTRVKPKNRNRAPRGSITQMSRLKGHEKWTAISFINGFWALRGGAYLKSHDPNLPRNFVAKGGRFWVMTYYFLWH